jgi:YD repeat-containing protein
MQYRGTLVLRLLRVISNLTRYKYLLGSTFVSRAFKRSIFPLTLSVTVIGLAHAANAQYAYDAAGRLIGVIDQNGNAAIYNYDANGNITSILRPAVGSINVLGFSPAFGGTGASITITGTGFSTTVSQNTVKFNGTAATVVSATSTQLVATVPAAATTGPISVTSQTGTASSGQSFTVTPPSAAGPNISGFTPTSGGYGDTVTISGSGFATGASQETVSFGGVDGVVTTTTATSITATVPAGGATGPIGVSTPTGSTSSSASFYVIPGGYTSVSVGATASIAAYGQSTTLNVANANQGYIAKFTGTAGDRVSVNILDGGSGMVLANVEVFNPNGSVLFGPAGTQTITVGNPYNPGYLLGPFVLPVTGIYSVLVAPQGGSTGTAQVSVYKVPADLSGTLASGSTTNFSLQTPGQNAVFTFSGAPGRSIYVSFGGPTQTYSEGSFSIYNPDGSLLFGTTELAAYPIGGSTIFNSPFALPQTGTYKIVIDPYQSYLYSGTLTFYYDNPSFITGTATAGGGALTLTTTIPGQAAQFTFSGHAGERAGFYEAQLITGGDGGLYGGITNPDGSVFQTFQSGTTDFRGPYVLAQTGNYKLTLIPDTTGIGSMTISYYDEASNPAATLIVGGATATLSTSLPSEGMNFKFAGSSGASITLHHSFTLTNGSCPYITIYNPDSTVLQSTSFGVCSSSYTFPTLPQTGNYVITERPTGGGFGSITTSVSH